MRVWNKFGCLKCVCNMVPCNRVALGLLLHAVDMLGKSVAAFGFVKRRVSAIHSLRWVELLMRPATSVVDSLSAPAVFGGATWVDGLGEGWPSSCVALEVGVAETCARSDSAAVTTALCGSASVKASPSIIFSSSASSSSSSSCMESKELGAGALGSSITAGVFAGGFTDGAKLAGAGPEDLGSGAGVSVDFSLSFWATASARSARS